MRHFQRCLGALVLAGLLLLSGCGGEQPCLSDLTCPEVEQETVPGMPTEPTELPEPTREIAPRPEWTEPACHREVDRYRPAYRMGSCRRLEGTVHVVTFLVDDINSSWTQESGLEFLDRCVTPGLAYLESYAAAWGIELEFDEYYFMTDDRYSMYYPYEFSPELSGATGNYDILDVLARNFGFEERYAMNDYFEDYFSTDEVLYFVALNKEGHSYTIPDSEDDGMEQLEYSAYFTGQTGGARNGAFVVAHETMHNFGAEDYYDPYGIYPNRKALAEQVYPDDLMMRWDEDVNNLYVSDATAFTVGWLDKVPDAVASADWWS